MTRQRTQKDIDNANTVERVKGAALLALGVLVFNPECMRSGWTAVTDPKANEFGSHWAE
jgi:hypothetical protein